MVKTCCITGHRDMSEEQTEKIRSVLKEKTIKALDDGFVKFMSSFTGNVDRAFAEIVLKMKKDHPEIQMSAVIPYRNKLNRMNEQEDIKALLDSCDDITVLKEDYQPNIYVERNRYLAEHSDRAIIVYDGREKGATVNMIRQIHRRHKEMQEIPVGLEIRL